jgi:hypothetical protein
VAQRDSRAVHGQPVVLAETFVDRARFSGGLFYLHPHTLPRSHMVIIIPEPDEACCEKSHRRTVRYSQIEGPIQADYPCYRAADWKVVIRGYGKTHACYRRHDAPKEVLLYPLRKTCTTLARAPRLPQAPGPAPPLGHGADPLARHGAQARGYTAIALAPLAPRPGGPRPARPRNRAPARDGLRPGSIPLPNLPSTPFLPSAFLAEYCPGESRSHPPGAESARVYT